MMIYDVIKNKLLYNLLLHLPYWLVDFGWWIFCHSRNAARCANYVARLVISCKIACRNTGCGRRMIS
jgi:hypothetical protein